MRIEFHPEAYEEMLESARFYEERVEGLGGDFLARSKKRRTESSNSRMRLPSKGPAFASALSLASP